MFLISTLFLMTFFTCAECSVTLRNKEALEKHRIIRHEGYKRYRCPHGDCRSTFEAMGNLSAHVRRRHPDKIVRKA